MSSTDVDSQSSTEASRNLLKNLKQFSYVKSPKAGDQTGGLEEEKKPKPGHQIGAENDISKSASVTQMTTVTCKEQPILGVKHEKRPANKRNRIVSDTDSELETEVQKTDKPAASKQSSTTTNIENSNDVDNCELVADLKSRIRTSYSTISKCSDIVASFNNSQTKPSSSKSDNAIGSISMVSFKRKRPVIFSSDDDDDDNIGQNKNMTDTTVADPARLTGENVIKETKDETVTCKIPKATISKCKLNKDKQALQERETSLGILSRLFPVLDYMECQEVLAVNSWSVDQSVKFLTALPNEQIDECLSPTPESNHVSERVPKPKKIILCTNGIKQRRNKVRFIVDSDSDDDQSVVYRIKPPSSEDKPPRAKKERTEGDTLKKKKKKVRASGGSDSGDDEYDRMQDVIYDSDASDDDDTLTPARNAILEFYQTAKMEELLVVPGCSRKKADAIVELRPFSGWLDLVCKFRSGRSMGTDLLNNAKDSLNSQRVVTKLMHNCEQLSKRMESQVARLMNNANFDDDGHLKKQPKLLNSDFQLTPYQLLGVNWLLLLHRQKVNGILADEMGLGKTIQATAFLTHLLEEGDDGPHLIVVPASTVDNWVRELNTWSPKLKVLVYEGSQLERRILRRRILNGKESSFNIIVATYNLVISNSEDRSLFRRIILRYVILDEAHLLKNMETQRYQHLMKINAKRRILLTGTPMQNNLVELMSLLVFVMPNMFEGKREHLKTVFAMTSKDDREDMKGVFEKDRISHAKQIMKPFVLRRLKVDVLRDLPNKTEEVEHCPMNEGQQRAYDELVNALSRQAREDKEKAISSSGIGMLMQLRKLANHPLLLRYHFTDEKLRKMAKLMLKEPTHREADPQLIFEDMQVMSDFELHKLCVRFKGLSLYILDNDVIIDSGKFSYLNNTLPTMKSNNHRVLLFSQFVMVLDIVEEYMKIVGHKYLRLDGSTPVSERMELIDQFTQDASIFVFLLSTKAGGLGINLTAANTVILHDIDFNPYNDKQAEDRCHRVGQTKDVRVIRLISKDTIEEDILRMATKKLKLEQDLVSQESDLNDGDSKNVASLLKQVLKL